MRSSTRWRLTAAIAATLAALVWWSLHPVCIPLTDAEATSVDGPISVRTDRQLHGPIFQYRDGSWHQCKSWISRQLFF